MTVNELIDALNRLKEKDNKIGKLPIKVEFDNYGEITQQEIDDVAHQSHITVVGNTITGKPVNSTNVVNEYILLTMEDY